MGGMDTVGKAAGDRIIDRVREELGKLLPPEEVALLVQPTPSPSPRSSGQGSLRTAGGGVTRGVGLSGALIGGGFKLSSLQSAETPNIEPWFWSSL